MIQNKINEENTWRMIPDNIEPGKGGGGRGRGERGKKWHAHISLSLARRPLLCEGEFHILRLFITFR